uniref:Reverse transcriptase Ty1/copia-type domain-containing protein n=1 Tax=Fagus sylvatica TaxID=28930 RepID=A0A2N9F457_FAGSY
MTPIFTNHSVDLYPNLVKDFALPPSSLDVPSSTSSPAAGSPTSDPAPSAPLESSIDLRHSHRIKTRADGFVEHYKACLVAKGFTQEYGIDYEETFAPVAHLTFVQSLLAVVTVLHWPLFQMDVKNAFLNSDLLKEGFTLSPYDSTLFPRQTSTGITLILLYVDDMIITIASSSDDYYLSQAKYASDFLSKAELTDSKIASSPLELNKMLLYTEQLVGSLNYLTVTRPDLAYVVHLVSQFMSAPRSTHYAVVLHILSYIKGMLFHGLQFSIQSSLKLRAYADADWTGDPTDRLYHRLLLLTWFLSYLLV